MKLKTRNEIAQAAIPYNPTATRGIYFLLLQGDVVYVGQSEWVESRFTSHAKLGKVFDAVHIIPVPEGDLNDLEAAYILEFRPPLNSLLPTNKAYVSRHAAKKNYGIHYYELKHLVKMGVLDAPIDYNGHTYYLREQVEKVQVA